MEKGPSVFADETYVVAGSLRGKWTCALCLQVNDSDLSALGGTPCVCRFCYCETMVNENSTEAEELPEFEH